MSSMMREFRQRVSDLEVRLQDAEGSLQRKRSELDQTVRSIEHLRSLKEEYQALIRKLES